MTHWADNIKFVKDLIDSKYKKIDDAMTDVRQSLTKLMSSYDMEDAFEYQASDYLHWNLVHLSCHKFGHLRILYPDPKFTYNFSPHGLPGFLLPPRPLHNFPTPLASLRHVEYLLLSSIQQVRGAHMRGTYTTTKKLHCLREKIM